MAITTRTYYRQPQWTRAVPGEPTVGQSSDAQYCTEASIDRNFGPDSLIGWGMADTPEEARRSAYAHLARQLDAYMAGR